MDPIGLGKLPVALLEKMLARHARPDASVLVGPGIGEDAAVIDMGERCLVAKTDPITAENRCCRSARPRIDSRR